MRLAYVMALLLLCLQAQAEIPWLQGGHTKLRALASEYPDDSAFHPVVGDWAYDQGADLRLKFSAQQGRFGWSYRWWKIDCDFTPPAVL